MVPLKIANAIDLVKLKKPQTLTQGRFNDNCQAKKLNCKRKEKKQTQQGYHIPF